MSLNHGHQDLSAKAATVAGMVVLAGCGLAGCASLDARSADAPDPIFGIGGEIPAILQEVEKSPYRTPSETCEGLDSEIRDLDATLGPDIDVDPAEGSAPSLLAKWVGDAVVGLVPYRDAVRFLGGAERAERARGTALLAGAARRSFLKGVRLER